MRNGNHTMVVPTTGRMVANAVKIPKSKGLDVPKKHIPNMPQALE